MGCEIMKIICNHGKLNYTTKQRFTVASEWQKRTSEDDDRNILKSWNTSVVFVLRGTRVLHRGTIYHSFGEINWWESEERAKAAVKKVREDCREEEKGVGWWERQLQGKKKWAMQQNSSVALWPQVLCCSNEAILTRSLWLCVLTTFPCCTTSTGHSFIEQSALCLSQSS